jgi:hypothetical protein
VSTAKWEGVGLPFRDKIKLAVSAVADLLASVPKDYNFTM